MSAGAPWSVKGIDPKAREVAKDLAHRSGMTLGEWLNRMIIESGEEAPEPGRFARANPNLRVVGGQTDLAETLDRLNARLDAVEQRLDEGPTAEVVLRDLGVAFVRLDGRLRSVEQGGASLEIARKMDAARIEMADKLSEVVQLAESLGRRVQSLETRGDLGGETVGEELARISRHVEHRLSRADMAQAQALEKLGAEIGRVTDRLAERIANAERRSALTIDDLAAQIARSAERQEQTSLDIAERIRLSEERTARMLEEARERIDASLAAARGRMAEQAAPAPSVARQAFVDTFAPLREAEEAMAQPAAEAEDDELFEEAPGLQALAFSEEEIEAGADDFAPLAEEPEVEAAEATAPAADDAFRPLSTREVIEQARAAARAAAQPDAKARGKSNGGLLFGGFGQTRKKRHGGATLQTALFVTGAAAALGAGVASYMLGVAEDGEKPAAVQPRIAVARAAPKAPAPAGPAAPDQRAIELYQQALSQLDAGEATAAATLKAAADLGHAEAQFHLARLHEAGESGVAKDLAEARRWTERAAQSGERRAMHNIGLYYFEGVGGPKNATTAAQWFQKAAELGLTDSQFNLGRLYEEGFGVSQNTAEAYKWYLIAARGGDDDAQGAAEKVRRKLSPEARTAAERSAGGFKPAQPAIKAGANPVETAQKALSRLGYYQGPADGTASTALRLALMAYQRDHGHADTGALEPDILAALAPYAR